jgi:threonine synthase
MPGVDPGGIVTHPEGNTPLLSRAAVGLYAGSEGLLLKHEGHNPTGSFKDRGMTVGMTQAVRLGAPAVACASTGNTAASLAAYAAQAGLRGLVLVPAGRTAAGKLAQTLAYGARTLAVRGDFDACLKLPRAGSASLGIYLLNSINPFRLEGQKTIVFEILQQLGWNPPDWIALPAGNLGNTSAFGKALVEAKEWGLISKLPASRQSRRRVRLRSRAGSPRTSPPDARSRRRRCHGHPHRRPRILGPRGPGHPRDQWRGAECD